MIKAIANRIKDVMQQCAPLGCIDCNGNVKTYPSAREAYTDAVIDLWRTHPAGYIDIPLVLSKALGVPIRYTIYIAGRRSVALIDFCHPTQKRNQQITHIIQLMLSVTGCEFSENAMKYALNELNTVLKDRGVLSDGEAYKQYLEGTAYYTKKLYIGKLEQNDELQETAKGIEK